MEFKLIVKKLNNTLSESEAIIFNVWYNESELHRDYFNNVKKGYNDDSLSIDIESGWKAIEKRIKPVSILNRNYFKYAVAASIVLLVSLSFIFQNDRIDKLNAPVIVTNKVEPGTDKAILTLEDGAKVVLEKGQQYSSNNLESNGENIVYKQSTTKTVELIYNYLTIPRGGQFFIKLSDGTKVWLNSESKLKYPVQFIEGETREVELVYGEAYFDVSSSDLNKGAKFKVFNRFQEVDVIGTEFNIKAYKDEFNIYTTLVEGIVTVNIDQETKKLAPNEQLNLNLESHNFIVEKVDVYNEISWKEGVFSFEKKPLKDIMKVLSRWYDVEVIFENNELEKVKFFGVLDKSQSIQEILETIKRFKIIESYEIKDQIIILK